MSVVKFMANIYTALKDAHFSPLIGGKIYVFDLRYDFTIPDRDQAHTLMGIVLLSGVFVASDAYEHKDRLTAKLTAAGVHCTIAEIAPPVPFHEAIK